MPVETYTEAAQAVEAKAGDMVPTQQQLPQEPTPSGEKFRPWLVTFDRAGFFGKYALGAIYQFNTRHEVELSLGISMTGDVYFGQANTAYRFSPWLYQFSTSSWKVFQIGAFAVYSMNSDYFISSPSSYPTPGYYDPTSLRLGGEFGTTYAFEKSGVELAYRLRILDLGVVALYNNAHRDLQYYISSGFEVHYRF